MLATLEPTVGLALAAGLLSFLSPCVFPLVPVYAGYLSGQATSPTNGPMTPPEVASSRRVRVPLLANGIAFVVGFSAVFILFYYLFAALEVTVFVRHQRLFDLVAGTVICVFALQTLGLLRLGSLLREFHLPIRQGSAVPGLTGSFVLGLSFAAGWSPCLGPQLGAILRLAQFGNFGGLPFMLLYCAGLAVPFLVVALLADRLQNGLRRLNRGIGAVNLIAGGLLLIFGLLLLTGRITVLTQISPSSPFDI